MRNTGKVYHFRALGPVIFPRLQVRDSLQKKKKSSHFASILNMPFLVVRNKHFTLLIDITVSLIIW